MNSRIMNDSRGAARVLLVAAAFGIALAGSQAYAGDLVLALSPPLIEAEMVGGGLRQFTLRAYNQGTEAVHVEVSVRDLTLDLAGSPVVQPTGSTAYSCAPWSRLSKERLDLPAGAGEEVVLTVSPPREAEGGAYGVVAFEAQAGALRRGEEELTVRALVGCVVMVTIRDQGERLAEIADLQIAPSGEAAEVVFAPVVENRGEVHFRASGSILIWSEDRRVLDRVPLEVGTGTVLPGGQRRFQGTWSNKHTLRTGAYVAEARIYIPGAPPLRYLRRFEVTVAEGTE
jgi:hypothetical protein